MKLAIYSDLHCEFETWVPPQEAAHTDVVILAGDIHTGIKGLIWAREHFKQPIIYVPGNHEYYKSNYQKLNKQLKEKATELDIHLLMDSSVIIDDVLFIGATLWTDFKLHHNQYNSQLAAQHDMNDYKSIRYIQGGKYRKLTPPDTVRMHVESLQFIKAELNEKQHSKCVVVTHHAPSEESISIDYKASDLSPCYSSNLEQDIIDMQYYPILWVHGHTHNNVDYHINNTRVLSNQRGYSPSHLNEYFDEHFIVNI
ncbi:MAG: metallophosphoesterase [Colwellia sp.]|nr:metallophosphoesterase [Colwellia sp.]